MKQDLAHSDYAWSRAMLLRRCVWNVTWAIVRPLPRSLSWARIAALRFFGATIGERCLISPGVRVLMPWNLRIGSCVAVGKDVDFYNFASITVGSNTSISQRSVLCTGTHDYTHPLHPLIWKPIVIGSNAWICAEAFIHPGINIGDGAVIGARAVVAKSMPAWMVCAGNPCVPLKPRVITDCNP